MRPNFCHRVRRRGGIPWALAAILGALSTAPAPAANYYELNGPVRLTSGGNEAVWMSKGSPSLEGAFDAASGAYVIEKPLVTLRGRLPFKLSWLFTSSDFQCRAPRYGHLLEL